MAPPVDSITFVVRTALVLHGMGWTVASGVILSSFFCAIIGWYVSAECARQRLGTGLDHVQLTFFINNVYLSRSVNAIIDGFYCSYLYTLGCVFTEQ